MKKFLKILSVIASVLGALAVINGVICFIIIMVNLFNGYNPSLYIIDQLFFILEIYLLFAAVSVMVFLQSLWVYYQITSKKPKYNRSVKTHQK